MEFRNLPISGCITSIRSTKSGVRKLEGQFIAGSTDVAGGDESRLQLVKQLLIRQAWQRLRKTQAHTRASRVVVVLFSIRHVVVVSDERSEGIFTYMFTLTVWVVRYDNWLDQPFEELSVAYLTHLSNSLAA